MNLTDWVVGNLKPYKLALNSPTRIGSFLPTIYGCVLPTLTALGEAKRVGTPDTSGEHLTGSQNFSGSSPPVSDIIKKTALN